MAVKNNRNRRFNNSSRFINNNNANSNANTNTNIEEEMTSKNIISEFKQEGYYSTLDDLFQKSSNTNTTNNERINKILPLVYSLIDILKTDPNDALVNNINKQEVDPLFSFNGTAIMKYSVPRPPYYLQELIRRYNSLVDKIDKGEIEDTPLIKKIMDKYMEFYGEEQMGGKRYKKTAKRKQHRPKKSKSRRVR